MRSQEIVDIYSMEYNYTTLRSTRLLLRKLTKYFPMYVSESISVFVLFYIWGFCAFLTFHV